MNTARNRVVRRAEELTPEARLERAKREIADGVVDLLEAVLARHSSTQEWVNQSNSPFNRRKHRRLWHSGIFKSAWRDGRDLNISRAELNEYIAKASPRAAQSEDEEVDDILDTIVKGGRS